MLVALGGDGRYGGAHFQRFGSFFGQCVLVAGCFVRNNFEVFFAEPLGL